MRKFPRLSIHQLIAIAIGLVVLLSVLVAWVLFRPRPLPGENSNTNSVGSNAVPVMGLRGLDGVPVAVAEASLRPWAVMIDNDPAARPQSGLAQASVVYEAVAEGGVTRFLALIDPAIDLAAIGPVRSARPYYAQWAAEYGALYVHSGGSPEALQLLRSLDVYNVEEISALGVYFARDPKRPAPHNLYTSSAGLRRYLKDFEIPAVVTFAPWQRKDDAALADRPASGRAVKIRFSTPAFTVTFRYDRERNRYVRWQGTAPHRTQDGTTIEASNVIIQHVRAQVTDAIGRRDVALQSGGLAQVYTDGVKHRGRWDVQDGRTRWVDSQGEVIPLNVGTTWVEIVDETTVIDVVE